eukprot:8265883-Pyramimonas_sp.AAC.1
MGSSSRSSGATSFIYEIGTRARYIGQGSIRRHTGTPSGAIARTREHYKALKKCKLDKPSADRARYVSLLASHSARTISIMFMTIMPARMATAVEASHIAFACPEANNIAKAYGDFATQKPMSARSRQQRNKGPRGRKNRHVR